MVKEFVYTSSKGTNKRKVLIIKENDIFIEGVDLSLLAPDQTKIILDKFKDYKPTTESVKIDGWEPAWNKAWRKFTKSKMVIPN